MAATTRNSIVNLVQISTFFVRTQLCEDMNAEGHLGPSAYSMLRDASALSGRRGTRKSWCGSFTHAATESISLAVLQTRKDILSLNVSHQHILITAFLARTQQIQQP